jgi:hypothetical protein
MPWVGFEHTIPVFEQRKTVRALDSEATVIGRIWWYQCEIQFNVQYNVSYKDLTITNLNTIHLLSLCTLYSIFKRMSI